MSSRIPFRAAICPAIATAAVTLSAWGQTPATQPTRNAGFDLEREKVLYCVGYAHLDTQWRWDYCTTIDRYIRDTLEQNFALFEKHPSYVFSFTGSARYEMMREYYPELYKKLKGYIAAGRWFVSGSSVDEGDVNVPSAEAIIRQVLYGNQFFRREFGKESVDFMLPDCFGFPASLPSIWAHCGLKGFSTQKLTWGSANGIPFKIGRWIGPDGKHIVAALDPGSYAGALSGRVDTNPDWVARVNQNGEKYGVFADFHYYGVGDQGGAPKPEDVANYVASQGNADGKITVALTSSDQLFRDLTPAQVARLPEYKGDLLLTEHSAGTLTSQSYMKRWNRMNENLADAAERASVAATWLGGASYPREKLRQAWVRALANQMHDILPGTSIPRAYTYSWNDELVAMNLFASTVTHGVRVVADGMETAVGETPIVIFNPLATARTEIVAVTTESYQMPEHGRAVGPDNVPAPAQITGQFAKGGPVTLLFEVKAAPLSLTTINLSTAAISERDDSSDLQVSDRTLENEYLKVSLNDVGDISSVIHKKTGREVLAKPAQLVFTHEKPANWPAWNMDWTDRQKAPLGIVDGPAEIRIVENGPVRGCIEVKRQARDSIITQRIRLSTGDLGKCVEIECDIDWQSTECALRASFPLTVANPRATYNWGMGTIERGNNDPKKYEVPSHEWFDLTAPDGSFGVSILDDSKYGSDKPSDSEVRLTLLYTPGVRDAYMDQHSQDWGRHSIRYAIYPHEGDWRDAQSESMGRRFNQPLRAFQTEPHAGPLGRSISLASVSTPQVDIRALKLAEESDATIVRLQELWGREAKGVAVSLGSSVESAVEVDGQEREIGPATVKDGKLMVDFTPYSPKSFAVKLRPDPRAMPRKPQSTPLSLAFDLDAVSSDANRADGAIDSDGYTMPAEQFPRELVIDDVRFQFGSTADGQKQAMRCKGQKIELPPGDFNELRLVLAATEDCAVEFNLSNDQRGERRTFQRWTGFIGQWDDRVWNRPFGEVDHRCEGQVVGIQPGFIKRDSIAWFATHRHHPKSGNESYRFSQLFHHRFSLAKGQRSITLPNEPRILLFAATAVNNSPPQLAPAASLIDELPVGRDRTLRYKYPEPPKPVFDGAKPRGAVKIERAETFDAVTFGPPRSDDAADAHTDPNLRLRFSTAADAKKPHGGSGAVGDALPRLNDGEVAQNDDDTQRCVWWDGPGRFHLDLGRQRALRGVRAYSWHVSNRAPQHFSLWGARGETMPDAGIRAGATGDWTLLGVVDSRSLGDGGKHASQITAADGADSLGQYRYLLWITENLGQGTFFTEIDVDAAP